MRRLPILAAALLLGTAVLTGCDNGSNSGGENPGANAPNQGGTQSQWEHRTGGGPGGGGQGGSGGSGGEGGSNGR